MSASMIVDPGAPRRMARSAGLGTGRLFLGFFVSALPALLVGAVTHSRYRTSGDEPSFAVSALIGLAVFAFVLLLLTGALFGFVIPQLTRVYSLTMPPGSPLRVDWFPDRMVVTSAGPVVRETLFSTISRVRVRPGVVVLDRGRGSAVLPIEVVPPPAVDLLRRATGGGVAAR